MSIKERIQTIKNNAGSVGFFSTNKNASNDEYMKNSELVKAWETVSANYAIIGEPEKRRGSRRKNKDAEETTKTTTRRTTRSNPIINNERGERE